MEDFASGTDFFIPLLRKKNCIWHKFSSALFASIQQGANGLAGRDGPGRADMLWIGGLLLKAGTQGMMPFAGMALALYLGSGVAIAAALFLLQDAIRVWPVTIPVLIPPILAFYVFALYQPSLLAGLAAIRQNK